MRMVRLHYFRVSFRVESKYIVLFFFVFQCFFKACREGKLEMVKYLIEKGAQPKSFPKETSLLELGNIKDSKLSNHLSYEKFQLLS
jgi:hypothetical protein